METNQESRKIEIGQETLDQLSTMRKWTLFFAILGFIGLGILLIIGIVAGSFMSVFSSKIPGIEGADGMESVRAAGGFAGILIFTFILLFAAVYFFPLLYLIRFSRHTEKAVKNFDQNELSLALKNMKAYWKYIGILIIVFLGLYLVALIFAGSTLALLKGLG